MSDSLDDFGRPNWRMSLCLLFAWIVVFAILSTGVKSAGKVGCKIILFYVWQSVFTSHWFASIGNLCMVLTGTNMVVTIKNT